MAREPNLRQLALKAGPVPAEVRPEVEPGSTILDFGIRQELRLQSSMRVEESLLVAENAIEEDLPEQLSPELVLICPELATFDPELSAVIEEAPAEEAPAPTPEPVWFDRSELPDASTPPAVERPGLSFEPRLPIPMPPAPVKERPSRFRTLLSLVGVALAAVLTSATITFAMTGDPSPDVESPLQLRPVTAVVPEGYSGNFVASQKPAPGTKLAAKDASRIVLHLKRNPEYQERGVPENSSE
jgi:fermentation-respiration switch protein FrsA (DUF1100 family)